MCRMHQSLSDAYHEEAAGDNPLVDGHEMSAVRASPNCEDGVEGYGEAVVATVHRDGVKDWVNEALTRPSPRGAALQVTGSP